MKVSFYVNCPYCGFQNLYGRVKHHRLATSRIVVNCDAYRGGCDRNFVATSRLVLEVSAKKIEGEEQKHDPTVEEAEAAHDQWVADGEIATAEAWADDPIRY